MACSSKLSFRKRQTVQRVETKQPGETKTKVSQSFHSSRLGWDPLDLWDSFEVFPSFSIVPSSPRRGPLQVLCVEDAGTRVLAGLQLHRGDEPAAGAARVVAERGAVRALGVLGVNDGGAPVADGLLPRLQVHLGLVAPPGAVPHGHHRLAVGGGRGEKGAVHLVPEVSVRVVLDLRVAPSGRRDASVTLETPGGSVET